MSMWNWAHAHVENCTKQPEASFHNFTSFCCFFRRERRKKKAPKIPNRLRSWRLFEPRFHCFSSLFPLHPLYHRGCLFSPPAAVVTFPNIFLQFFCFSDPFSSPSVKLETLESPGFCGRSDCSPAPALLFNFTAVFLFLNSEGCSLPGGCSVCSAGSALTLLSCVAADAADLWDTESQRLWILSTCPAAPLPLLFHRF